MIVGDDEARVLKRSDVSRSLVAEGKCTQGRPHHRCNRIPNQHGARKSKVTK